MKKYSILFLLLFIPLFLHAEGFRNSSWGMSAGEVQATEKDELVLYEGDVYSVLGTEKVPVFGMDCITLYFFSHNDRLVKGGFFFEPGYRRGAPYIEDYNQLKKMLTKVFGEGEEEILWYSGKPGTEAEYGDALEDGELTLFSTWKTGETYVELFLGSDEYGYALMIQYFSVKLYDEYTEMLRLREEASEQRTGSYM